MWYSIDLCRKNFQKVHLINFKLGRKCRQFLRNKEGTITVSKFVNLILSTFFTFQQKLLTVLYRFVIYWKHYLKFCQPKSIAYHTSFTTPSSLSQIFLCTNHKRNWEGGREPTLTVWRESTRGQVLNLSFKKTSDHGAPGSASGLETEYCWFEFNARDMITELCSQY